MGLIIRSSDIHAAGCYTTAPIRKRTRIIEYTGPRMPKSQADQLYAGKPYTYLFGLSDSDTVIDGHGMAAFINHCCEPNCETEEDEAGRIWIVAVRDIQPGEELTYDYYLYDGEGEEPCFCRAGRCRGTMYSPAEIRRRRSMERRRELARKKKSSAKKRAA